LKNEPLFKGDCFFCPLHGWYVVRSPHLAEVFKDRPKAEWLANMVTHYRHSHITSWNKMWSGWAGSYYRRAAHFGDYDQEKRKVNERAKRQILRQARDYLIAQGVRVEDFEALQGTTRETLSLARRVLPGVGQQRFC
jgi:hypothetical protein